MITHLNNRDLVDKFRKLNIQNQKRFLQISSWKMIIIKIFLKLL